MVLSFGLFWCFRELSVVFWLFRTVVVDVVREENRCIFFLGYFIFRFLGSRG